MRIRLGLLVGFVLIVVLSACNNGDSTAVENAESYLVALSQADGDTARQYLCERRKHDVDRIVERMVYFDNGEADLSVDGITCQEDGRYVTCSYSLVSTVYEIETVQEITETYHIEDDRLCGTVNHDQVMFEDTATMTEE